MRGRILLAAAVVAAGWWGLPATAQNQNAAASRPVVVAGAESAVDRILLAESVARFARQTGDASAMIVAARMIRNVEVKQTDFKGVVSGGPVKGPAPSSPSRFPSFTGYLAEARSMAAGNQVLRAEIAALEAEKDKGLLHNSIAGQALSHRMVMPPGGKWSFDIVAEANKPTIIGVINDGDSNVDIYVYDTRGEIFAQDTSPSHAAVVRWTPTSVTRYRVVIHNTGPFNTLFTVMSN